MTLENKCLLVLNPASALQSWLQSLIQSARAMKLPQLNALDLPAELSLESLQYDSNCYILPVLSREKTVTYLEAHSEELFTKELTNWCKIEVLWPNLTFANFASCFNFQFYYDWMNFQEEEKSSAIQNDLATILLVIKPNEAFKEFLRPLLLEKYKLDPAELEKKLDLAHIRNGSTAVISDITSLDDLEYFLDRHFEEIFIHQLTLWGGPDSESFWPRDLNLETFKEWFSVEIHRHTHCMPQ